MFFDRLAAFSRTPDASFKELRMMYGGDDHLRVPAAVFNGALNRSEAVWR